MKKAVIVLPTYNESANVPSLLQRIFEVTKSINNWYIQVLVVDSESEDKTEQTVRELQNKYSKLHLLSTKKEGLGKAYLHGFEHAIKEHNSDVIFQMDADLSHNPEKLPDFLNHIDNGADFVIGSRYIKGGSIPEDWAAHRKIFSVLGNLIIKYGFMNLKISDWTSGYRAIKVDVIKEIMPKVDNYTGYVFQVAILDNAKKYGAKIAEVPIHFIDRKIGSSKINSVEYIIQTLMYVFFESSFIKFVIVGGTGFVLDTLLLYILALQLGFPAWLSKLISAETVIISNFTFNNFWSFSHKRIEESKKAYFKGLFKFNLVSAGNVVIQMIGIQTLTHFFGKQWILIYNVFIILFFVIPYSYLLYNKVIWKDKKEQEKK